MSNTSNNNVGSAILALSGMITRTYKKPASGKQVKCAIALEKAGVIRPIEDRVKTGKALSSEAYKAFSKLAKGGDEGAARVVELADQLAKRTEEITAYKNGLAVPA